MVNDGTKAAREDDRRIDILDGERVTVDNDHHLIYWSFRFGCTREQLMAAVQKVGHSVPAVEADLLKKRYWQ